MSSCAACGQRVGLGGRRILRKMARVERLISELQRAQREAHKQVLEHPPEVRSALLAVKTLLDRLVERGGGLTADLHEAAHDRTFLVDAGRVRDWESTAEEVLLELLAVLEETAARERGQESD